MGGWRRIGSDDDFQIRQALPLGLARTRFLLLATVFLGKNMYIKKYNTFIFYPLSVGQEGCWDDGNTCGDFILDDSCLAVTFVFRVLVGESNIVGLNKFIVSPRRDTLLGYVFST